MSEIGKAGDRATPRRRNPAKPRRSPARSGRPRSGTASFPETGDPRPPTPDAHRPWDRRGRRRWGHVAAHFGYVAADGGRPGSLSHVRRRPVADRPRRRPLALPHGGAHDRRRDHLTPGAGVRRGGLPLHRIPEAGGRQRRGVLPDRLHAVGSGLALADGGPRTGRGVRSRNHPVPATEILDGISRGTPEEFSNLGIPGFGNAVVPVSPPSLRDEPLRPGLDSGAGRTVTSATDSGAWPAVRQFADLVACRRAAIARSAASANARPAGAA